MRLSPRQRTDIIDSIRETFGPEAKAVLFGSRADDTKFGGDIDLLVEVRQMSPESLFQKIQALGKIQRKIGDQKIDLVITDGTPEREELLVVKNARQQGVVL